jgi:MFS family permease
MRFSPFTLLCVTGLFAIFSSTIAKSPVLPLFASFLGIDPAGVGFVASVSSFTGVIFSIPAGILADRIGRRKALVFSAFIFASAPFLYMFVTEIWHLALVRFYHGMATAVFMPVAMALISELFHLERGEKIGWFSTSTLLGRFVAPMVGGSIIGVLSLNPGIAYQTVYLACGFAGLLTLLLTYQIPIHDSLGHGKEPWRQTWTRFKALLTVKGILVTSVAEGAVLFAYGAFETFLPLHALKIGLTPYHVGVILSTQVISIALTKPFMGRFSDKHGRTPQIFYGALLGALSIAGFYFVQSLWLFLLFSVLFGLSISTVTSATSAYIGDLSKKQTLGAAMGVLASVMDIGHTTGPLFSGLIAARFNLASVFVFAAFVLIMASAIFYFFNQRSDNSHV